MVSLNYTPSRYQGDMTKCVYMREIKFSQAGGLKPVLDRKCFEFKDRSIFKSKLGLISIFLLYCFAIIESSSNLEIGLADKWNVPIKLLLGIIYFSIISDKTTVGN